MGMASIPKVALLIETSRGYGRGLLRGIVRYARLHGPWAFYLTPADFKQELPRMKAWGGTGIIARVETPEIARHIAQSGLPTVCLDLTDEQLDPSTPLAHMGEIHPDAERASELAAEHLIERGFRHFAFVGVPGHRPWSDQRQAAFVRRLAGGGLSCHEYRPPERKTQSQWSREEAVLGAWLRKRPRPLGLMACNDDRGRQVLEACRATGIRVPDEIAVVGVDNDELLCEMSDPPLSSVVLNAEQGGFEAARLLDDYMRGRRRGPGRLLVEPLYVVTRGSSDIVAMEDGEVAAALRFIRENACRTSFQVDDAVQQGRLSRRTLEIRFRKALGRSVQDEIERVRLERVKRLLAETDTPVARLAELAGFSAASYMGLVFHRETGKTPRQYRTYVRSR